MAIYSPGERKIIIVAVNAIIIFIIVGSVAFEVALPPSADIETTITGFVETILTSCWIVAIPLIGKLQLTDRQLKIFFFTAIAIKAFVIVAMEFINSFPGVFDLQAFSQGALKYTSGGTGGYPVPFPPYYVNLYYPPGSTYLWFFYLLIDPNVLAKSLQSLPLTTMDGFEFRFYGLGFEAATVYMVYKIGRIESLGVPKPRANNGVAYCLFALSIIVWYDVYGKYDMPVIFLSLVGYYLFVKKKYFYTGLVWSFDGFIKLYTFIWIACISLILLKRTKLRQLVLLVAGTLVPAIIILPIDFHFQGMNFINSIIGFRPQLSQIYALYNQNIWFYLNFLNLPGMNVVPFALLGITCFYFAWHWKGDITPQFIAGTMAITMFFYPAINPQYMALLMPFVCINMLGNERRTRNIAILEYVANIIIFSLPIYAGLLGYTNYSAQYVFLSKFPRLDFFAWECCSLAPFLISMVMIASPETIDRIMKRFIPRKKIVEVHA